jgi:hypothetical protein
VLTDKHKRNNRVWFLVHWRDTFVVNGRIIYNHYLDVPKLVVPKKLKKLAAGLDVKIQDEPYNATNEQKWFPSPADRVHRFIWPPCWLPRTQICEASQSAKMFKLAEKLNFSANIHNVSSQ